MKLLDSAFFEIIRPAIAMITLLEDINDYEQHNYTYPYMAHVVLKTSRLRMLIANNESDANHDGILLRMNSRYTEPLSVIVPYDTLDFDNVFSRIILNYIKDVEDAIGSTNTRHELDQNVGACGFIW